MEKADRERRRSFEEPSTSAAASGRREMDERRMNLQEETKQLIQRAERAKATLYQVPGKTQFDITNPVIDDQVTKGSTGPLRSQTYSCPSWWMSSIQLWKIT